MACQIVFVCVALLALQATHAFPSTHSIWQGEVDKIHSAVQDAIARVEDAVSTIHGSLETAVHNEVAKVENSVNGFAQKVADQIEAIKTKAETEGKAVAGCFLAVPGELKNVAEQVIQEAITCVTNPINEGRAIIKNLVDLAQQINETFYSADAAVTACDSKGGALERSLCKLNALSGVAIKVTLISSKITAEVAKGAALIAGLQTNFSTCEVTVWIKAPVHAASIIATVNQCIQNAVFA